LLIEFIIYKKAFLSLGWSVVWQNIPSTALSEQIAHANLLDIIYSVGTVTFIFGIAGVIFGVSKDKTHSALIVTSVAVAPLVLLALKIFTLTNVLLILGPTLAVMSAVTMKKSFAYLRITKFSKYEILVKWVLFLLIVGTIVVPSYFTSKQVILDTITDDEIKVLEQLKTETEADATVASSAEEGHYITYFAERKDVIDNNFLYVPNIESRYNDITLLYTTISDSEALEIARKYGINCIYLSQRTKDIFGIKELKYATNEKCFRKVASSGAVEAYKIRC